MAAIALVSVFGGIAVTSLLSASTCVTPTTDRTPTRSLLATESERCDTTVSNGHLVADSRGNVCDWRELDMLSSCCAADAAGPNVCAEQCDAALACCARYEHCVACCVRASADAARSDAFRTCQARCRTHSGSASARAYVDDNNKHCYGDYNAPAPAFDRVGFALDKNAGAGTRPTQVASYLVALMIVLPFVLR